MISEVQGGDAYRAKDDISEAGELAVTRDCAEGLALLGITGCIFGAALCIPFVEYSLEEKAAKEFIATLPTSIRGSATTHCTGKASQYCSGFLCYPGAISITESPVPSAVSAFSMLSGLLSVTGLIGVLIRAGLYASDTNASYHVLGKKFSLFVAMCSLLSGISGLVASSFSSTLIPGAVILFFPFAVFAPLALSLHLKKRELPGRQERCFQNSGKSPKIKTNFASPQGPSFGGFERRSVMAETFESHYLKSLEGQRCAQVEVSLPPLGGTMSLSSGQSSDALELGSAHSKTTPRRLNSSTTWETADPLIGLSSQGLPSLPNPSDDIAGRTVESLNRDSVGTRSIEAPVFERGQRRDSMPL